MIHFIMCKKESTRLHVCYHIKSMCYFSLTFTSCTLSVGGLGWEGPFARLFMLLRSDRKLCLRRS